MVILRTLKLSIDRIKMISDITGRIQKGKIKFFRLIEKY